jgi:hypothetical protein
MEDLSHYYGLYLKSHPILPTDLSIIPQPFPPMHQASSTPTTSFSAVTISL